MMTTNHVPSNAAPGEPTAWRGSSGNCDHLNLAVNVIGELQRNRTGFRSTVVTVQADGDWTIAST